MVIIYNFTAFISQLDKVITRLFGTSNYFYSDMYTKSTLSIIFSLAILCNVAQSQRSVCPPDTLLFTMAKATAIDTLALDPQTTSAAYQYFEAPQEITVSGARFYGYKTDTAGGNSVTITVELRRAGNDSVPNTAVLASADYTLTVPDSLDGPLSAYAVEVTWAPTEVDAAYVIVVKTDPLNPSFTILHNHLDGTTPDGDEEWLSGVKQGVSWIRSYAYLPTGVPFDADFLIEPFVSYNMNASFVNDPECLFDELGETVVFYNEGAAIADSRMYNRYAFYNLPDRQKWVFGDGTPATFFPNPFHFYPTNGPFAATLTTKILSWTNQACLSSVTQIIKEKPDQEFSYTTQNLEVNFTNETFGLFSDIYYDFGDGNTSQSENPVHKYAEPGTYWVCQTMMTSCGEIQKCKNVAVATNTALNCGKDSVRYTAARASSIRTVKLKPSNPGRLLGLGQRFDVSQPIIIHGFTFYANHEGLFKDSYPVTCRIFNKGSNNLPDGEALAESIVRINKYDVDTNYSDTVRYTAIFNKPVNLTADYILTIEYDSTVPVHIGTSDWEEHDGEGDLLAIGKINDTTWVTAASVAVFNVNGAAFDADVILEPLVEYNLDANFTWDFECMDCTQQPVSFQDLSSKIIRNKIYNTIAFYTSSAQAFEWNFDDGTPTSHLIDAVHTFVYNDSINDPYDVSLTILMDGWTNDCANTQVLTVPVHPVGGFGYEQLTSQVNFSDSSYFADAFLWTFEDGTVSTLQNPIHFFTEIGTYEVCQYVSNECGSDTICQDITINVIGIPDLFMKHMHIYPNPALDYFNVTADLSMIGSLELSLQDLSGRVVRQMQLDYSNTSQLYVGDLARGTYILKIKAGQFEGTKKVVLAN